MRPPPPASKCNLQGPQGPTARREEAAARQPSPPVSVPGTVVTQAPSQSHEPPRKRDFKLFAWGLTIAGCGLLVLAAGALVVRQELDHLRQLVAEYEAKKRDLETEYEARKRELTTEDEAKKRELVAEYEAKERELETGYEAKRRDLETEYQANKRELAAEYQAKKDQSDTETRQAIAEYERGEEQVVAEYGRRLEAMLVPNDGPADDKALRPTGRVTKPRRGSRLVAKYGSIFGLPRSFAGLSPEDLDETERLGPNWRSKVDWNSPVEDFGKFSRPDRVETNRYQYFVDNQPITRFEVEQYLGLPQETRNVVCSLSRRRLLEMPRQPSKGRAGVKAQAPPSSATARPEDERTSGSTTAP